jgi:hypothetical protein
MLAMGKRSLGVSLAHDCSAINAITVERWCLVSVISSNRPEALLRPSVRYKVDGQAVRIDHYMNEATSASDFS